MREGRSVKDERRCSELPKSTPISVGVYVRKVHTYIRLGSLPQMPVMLLKCQKSAAGHFSAYALRARARFSALTANCFHLDNEAVVCVLWSLSEDE